MRSRPSDNDKLKREPPGSALLPFAPSEPQIQFSLGGMILNTRTKPAVIGNPKCGMVGEFHIETGIQHQAVPHLGYSNDSERVAAGNEGHL